MILFFSRRSIKFSDLLKPWVSPYLLIIARWNRTFIPFPESYQLYSWQIVQVRDLNFDFVTGNFTIIWSIYALRLCMYSWNWFQRVFKKDNLFKLYNFCLISISFLYKSWQNLHDFQSKQTKMVCIKTFLIFTSEG